LIVLFPVIPGRAQAQSVSFGAGGGVSAFTHDDLKGEDPGTTLGLDVLIRRSAHLQVGVGLDYSRYGVPRLPELTEMNLLGIIRWTPSRRALTPYFAGKAGVSRQTVPLVTQNLMLAKPSTWGLTVGPSVGVLIPVRFGGLEASADAMYMRYGALEPDEPAGGVLISGSAYSGIRVTGRIGVRIDPRLF